MALNRKMQKGRGFWENHYNNWKAGSLSQSEYCRQNSLNSNSFSNWKIKFEKVKTNFVEIDFSPSFLSNDGDLELIIKGIYKLKLKPDFNQELLKKVLSILDGSL